MKKLFTVLLLGFVLLMPAASFARFGLRPGYRMLFAKAVVAFGSITTLVGSAVGYAGYQLGTKVVSPLRKQSMAGITSEDLKEALSLCHSNFG